MRIPAFLKTIRFRLTVLYVSFMLLLVLGLAVGVNVMVAHTIRSDVILDVPEPRPDLRPYVEAFRAERGGIVHRLGIYSAIGVGAVIVLGSVGGYFLTVIMLKPVDRVSSLAGRISYSTLKERLNYKGQDDEIKRLADTFDDMLERLDTAVESQKQFVQDASHELRTPIATAIANIEVLEMDENATPADYQKVLGVLKLSLERMHGLSDSLLLLSEAAPSVLKWSKVDMSSIVTEAVNEARAAATQSGVSLEWKIPTREAGVSGDAMRLKQAVINLIDNAIKYNRPGGSVILSVRPENTSVIVEVTDSGIGISKEDSPRVFDRFFRVDRSRSRERGGSGLGLAIVKKIVTDHDGNISVESTSGIGSTFRISLPAFLSH